MKNENVKSMIEKEQLLAEQEFIYYCRRDEASSSLTTKLDIEQPFLKAAEKDGFIKPLLKIKEKIKKEDGTEKLEMVKYYSPFHIYLVLELSKNIIDNDGYLRNPFNLDWQKEKNFRWVNWGGAGITMDKKRRRNRNIKFASDNLPLFCDYFYRFLKFLHTLELKPDYTREIEERRLSPKLPSLAYNFEPLKNKGLKLLTNHHLNIEILNILRKEVARLATRIDPLEHWYYYIKRHTQFKKDLLKGDAALAQELYQIYNLLSKIVKTVTGKESEPLFELLYQGSPGHPFLIPKVEYQDGEDVKALQFAIQQFKEWQEDKGNKLFITEEVVEKLSVVEKKIKKYEQQYSDKSYAGSARIIEAEKKIKFEDLDKETKRYVNDDFKQTNEQDFKIETEIAFALENRLSELKRELRDVLYTVSKKLNDNRNEAWQKEHNFSNWFWSINKEKLANLTQEKHSELWEKEYNKIRKKAEKWNQREEEFAYSVSKYTDLVFCKVCRKNPVQLHIENNNLNMWEISRSVICDECIQNRKLEKIESGEWECSCDKVLYKFAHNNTVALQTRNNVDIKIEISYGKSILEATCPQCGEKNQRIIDWGWMP